MGFKIAAYKADAAPRSGKLHRPSVRPSAVRPQKKMTFQIKAEKAYPSSEMDF